METLTEKLGVCTVSLKDTCSNYLSRVEAIEQLEKYDYCTDED